MTKDIRARAQEVTAKGVAAEQKKADAKEHAQLIRDNFAEFSASGDKLSDALLKAYKESHHIILGYDSWEDYASQEFGEMLKILQGKRWLASFREHGLSTRAISAIVGVSQSTVSRELRSGDASQNDSGESNDSTPPAIRGRDGKTYDRAAAAQKGAETRMRNRITKAIGEVCETLPADGKTLGDIVSSAYARIGGTVTPDDIRNHLAKIRLLDEYPGLLQFRDGKYYPPSLDAETPDLGSGESTETPADHVHEWKAHYEYVCEGCGEVMHLTGESARKVYNLMCSLLDTEAQFRGADGKAPADGEAQ